MTRFVILASIFIIGPCTSWGQPPPPQDDQCTTRLIDAIRLQKLDEIHALIKSGVDLNEKTCPEGNTALFESIGGGPRQVTAELIEAGADANETDTSGLSPLMAAAWYCRLDIVALLLEKHASINTADKDGYTALMNAAQTCEDGRMVATLIRAGAPINSKTKSGDTALTTAAFYGNEAAVMELVAAGADVNIANEEGETALAIARERDVGRKPSHDRICTFLETFSGPKSIAK